MIQPAALLAAACALALAAASPSEVRGAAMTFVAKGPFDVKVTPLDPRPAGEPAFGRLRMDKTFHGGLEATSTGEMLSWGGAGGAAAYVALDHVEGTLDGRRGTFVLQHAGTMSNDDRKLTVAVVPGSATGELAGLTGVLRISIAADGAHSYELEYRLPEPGRSAPKR